MQTPLSPMQSKNFYTKLGAIEQNSMKTIPLVLFTFFMLIAKLAHAATGANLDNKGQGIVRLALSQEAISFDPLKADTIDSRRVHELVYQRLLSYDPSKSEIRLQTQLAASMPKPIHAGLAFDVEIGTAQFMPSKTSKLAARALSARDVLYTFERLLRECDTEMAECSLLRTHIKTVEIRNKQTIRFHLHAADFDFPYLLALPITAVLAPEGVAGEEFFGSQAFHVKESRRDLLVLERTPSSDSLIDNTLGMPIQQLHFRVIKDKREQLQQFLRGELDFIDQLGALERNYFANGALSTELINAGAHLSLIPEAEIIYYYLSSNDPTFGGDTPAQIALRRAILKSYSVPKEITTIRAGLGQVTTHIVPPEFPEQQKPATSAFTFAPDAANAELDKNGFTRGSDGWRRLPNGEMLTLNFTSEPMAVVEPYREARRAQLAAVGIRMNSVLDNYPNNVKRAQDCKAPFWGAAWSAIIPTPGYVLSVLRSDRIGKDNLTCYQNSAFDQLHQQAQRTASGPKRAALYHQLSEMVQRDAIWQMGVRRQRAVLIGPRLAGYRAHSMLYAPWDSLRIVSNSSHTSEEITYLKALPGQQAALAEFIRRNWFAMDLVAQKQGLIADFELVQRTPSETASDWDLMVRVRYPHPSGYAAIASEFEAIRNTHENVLIEGKSLRELGRIVRSEQLPSIAK
jgi:oligopeptide transport system substrate-binding protein